MGLQLLEQAGLKLAHPFAGDVVAFPDFPQRDRIVGQEAVLKDIGLLFGKRGQDVADLALEQFGDFHTREAFLNAGAERGQEVHARGAAGIVADSGVEGHIGGVQPLLHLHDLILANATPALQAASTATQTIPILGTAVTEYGVALDIKDFSGTVGGNISGTSDLAPLDQQADMLLELLPDAKNVGILYCSAEANSVYQADVVKAALEAKGVNVTVYTFADSNDVATVTQTACSENDALYIPTDNTAASCTEAINNVAEPAGVPIVAGEEGICKGCGIATLSIDYYELGRTTGAMAAKILTGESNVSEMPIEYYQNPVKKYDAARCEALGITVPSDYAAIG